MSPIRWLALLSFAVLACSSGSTSNPSCPCASGWTCCIGANVCVEDVSVCEELRSPPACTDACEEGARTCGITTGVTECERQANGCTAWSAVSACAAGDQCGSPDSGWTGTDACDCGAEGGCVALDRIVPDGPYIGGQQIELYGANFALSTGGLELRFDGKPTPAISPDSDDGHLIVTVPDLEGSPDGGAREVVLSILAAGNPESVVQRVIPVAPAPRIFAGNINVEWMGSTSATADDHLLLRYRLVNVGTVGTVVQLLPRSVDCPSCGGAAALGFGLVDVNGAYLPNDQVFVDTRSPVDVFLRVDGVVAGKTFAVALDAATPTSHSLSGFQRLVGGEAIPQPSQDASLVMYGVTGESLEPTVEKGFVDLHQGPYADLVLGGELPPGRYDVIAATSPETQGWTVSTSQSTLESGASDGGVEGYALRVSVAPGADAGVGELDIAVTNQDTGEARTLQLGLLAGP